MNNDPISQLPEPYRVAWEILHEPFEYHQMLKNVLVAAQKMVGATWGMMILKPDVGGLEHTFPGFRTLPDMYNTTIPVGYITSMAYVLARKVIEASQSILIPDMDNIIPSYEEQLLSKFLPKSTQEMILKRAEEKWFASRLLEIPSTSRITAMAISIIGKDKTIGSVYLHRHISEGIFTDEALQKVKTFLSCVAIGINNAKEVSDIKNSGFQILAIGSSEIRTPLIVIKGYAQIIRDGLIKLPEGISREDEIKKYASTIINNSERIKTVLDDLLDYARIEQGYVYKQGINLKDVFNPILGKYQPLVNDKHQTLTLDLPDSLDIEIEAEHYLSPLIDMLVRGAHLNTPEGGEIKISIALDQGIFQFRVSDTGTSLTEEEQAHFFQRYYHTNWEESIRSSGLSLYLAKRVIELWDGQIGVESMPNQGNTLWFTIPIKK
jgi:signal transduction histidine kinase